MPRRSSARGPSRTFSSAPARPTAVAPAPPAAPAPVGVAAQPKQPGLLAQAASTAGGVAVGSVVGHTINRAMFGGGDGQQTVEAAPPVQQQQQLQANNGPCGHELSQFLQCAQNQSDISLCYGFNEALKQCKLNNGLQI
ncbi:DgyrCDS9568 [Dimorphilus gyrociliatus]|uniref:DgyrCDS9568 n=1 Tax=Dimorphilus gyrociliatus TaxID=2664684 RepID=A0A7I8VZK1_9ANNE|nr:DgyrCDS9568 [Dimorphilus gyrociliatus]